jgi:maltokinase
VTDDLLTHVAPEVVAAYLEKTRWFGGKGRPFTVTAVRRLGRLGDVDPAVDVLLAELTYADVPAGAADAVELYQVPLALYSEPEHRLDHAFVGWWEDPDRGWTHAYDALHDREAMALWLAAFGAATDGPVVGDGLTFHRLPGFDLDLEATSALFTGEQSNSSVAFGDDSMFKLFRKVTPGRNPDITTHEALTRAGSPHVASLYGWVEAAGEAGGTSGGEPLQLGMLQQFLRTATDGWDLALSSVRTLYAEPDLEPRQSGGDFAGEAERLGEALRDIHQVMHERLPVDPATVPAPSELAAAMERRLERALAIVPELARYADGLRAAYAALAGLPVIEVQQIHGDLHLGQTLRTALGWKVVDFEGEPAKSLADRLLPDSPWRDVAGMLRSFDYAPYAVDPIEPADAAAGDSERRALGAEWTARAQRYFLTAYAGGALGTVEQTLVDAYVADKAVYETVYETRNRPEWLPIPLAAVALIGAHA